jgi:hypothetical protein
MVHSPLQLHSVGVQLAASVAEVLEVRVRMPYCEILAEIASAVETKRLKKTTYAKPRNSPQSKQFGRGVIATTS